MVQASWFDAGPDQPGRLALVAHHLAVDGVAGASSLGDLAVAATAVATGRSAQLEPVGTSLRAWSPHRPRRGPRPRAASPSWAGWLATHRGRRRARARRRAAGHGRHRGGPHRRAGSGRRRRRSSAACPPPCGPTSARSWPPPCCWPPTHWRARRGHAPRSLLVDVEGHGREDLGRRSTSTARSAGSPPCTPSGSTPAGRRPPATRSRRSRRRCGPRPTRPRLRHAAPPQRPDRAAAGRRPRAQVAAQLPRPTRPAAGGGDWQPAPESEPPWPLPDAGMPLPYLLQIDPPWTTGRRPAPACHGARAQPRAGRTPLGRGGRCSARSASTADGGAPRRPRPTAGRRSPAPAASPRPTCRRRARPGRHRRRRAACAARPPRRRHLAAVAAAGGPVLPRHATTRSRASTSTPCRTTSTSPAASTSSGCAPPRALLRRQRRAAGRVHQRRACARPVQVVADRRRGPARRGRPRRLDPRGAGRAAWTS